MDHVKLELSVADPEVEVPPEIRSNSGPVKEDPTHEVEQPTNEQQSQEGPRIVINSLQEIAGSDQPEPLVKTVNPEKDSLATDCNPEVTSVEPVQCEREIEHVAVPESAEAIAIHDSMDVIGEDNESTKKVFEECNETALVEIIDLSSSVYQPPPKQQRCKYH
jgi:hypothetical protein